VPGSKFRELGRERPRALQPVRATGETTDSVSKVSPDAAYRREHLGEDKIYTEDANEDGHRARQQLQSASHRVRE